MPRRLALDNYPGCSRSGHRSREEEHGPEADNRRLDGEYWLRHEEGLRVDSPLKRRDPEVETIRDQHAAPEGIGESLPDLLISRFDRGLRHIYANRLVETVTGLPTAALLGKSLGECGYSASLVALWEQEIRQVFATGASHGVQLTLAIPSGPAEFEVQFVPELASDGSIGSVLVIGRDATDRMGGEAGPREPETFFSSILENLPNVVFLKDAKDLRFVRVNRAAEELLGCAREEFHGRNNQEIFLPADAASFTSIDREVLRDKRPVDIPEETVQTRSGGPRILHVKKMPLLDDTGNPRYLLGVAEDITDQKQLQGALADRTWQLEAVQAVLADVSRELNLPLLLQIITRRAAELLGGAVGACFLWDEPTHSLIPHAWYGEPHPSEQTPRRLGEGLTGAVALRREGMRVNEYRTSPHALSCLLEHTKITAALAVPLLYHDRLLGVLALDNRGSGQRFSDHHLGLLRLFADHAAIAIEHSRLFTAKERSVREARGLCDVAQCLASSLDPEEVLHLIVEKTTELLGTPHAQIVFWDEATQTLYLGAAHGTEGEQVKGQVFELGKGVNGIVAQTRAPLIVNDYQGFPHRIRAMTQLVADVAVPIFHRGQFLGVLDTHTTEAGRGFTSDDVTLLLNLANQAAVAIENARLFRREQARRKELEAVRAVVEEISRELDLSTVLRLIHEHALDLAQGDSGVIYLWDEAARHLIPEHWHGHGDWLADLRIRLGEGVAGTVAARRQGMMVNDFRTSPYATPPWLERARFVAVLVEPLLYRDRLVGVITAAREDPDRPFMVEDQRLLRLFATQAAIAIENARLFAELTQSYQDLHAAQAELIRAEKLRALGQLAAGMAHDLNNTLAAILGQVELLQLCAPPPEMREGLNTLATAVADGAHVIRRLQGFAHQQTVGELEVCHLGEIVQEAVTLTRPRWRDESQRQGRMITVHTEIASGLPPILGCPAEIRDALTNLVCNAVDAMPAGGVLTISGRECSPGSAEWVELVVADTGVGMPAEVLERAFDPFFTTKGPRGTGLGLSLVYSTMERHGGRMDAASAPGQGTTITLRFRRAPSEPLASGSAQESPRPPARRILLVDDDPRVRTSVAGLLRAMGHLVTEAESGRMAIRLLAETSVDLLLTDFSMPDLTGLDVARAVKTSYPGLPIVMLTGWGEQAEQEGEQPSPVDRVLGKPVRLQELLAVIADLTGPPPG